MIIKISYKKKNHNLVFSPLHKIYIKSHLYIQYCNYMTKIYIVEILIKK